MARLRVRFRFNPGRTGAPMDKLGDFASQTERFLRSLARDLGVPAKKGGWLALEFTNDSVAFDGQLSEAVPAAVVARGNEALELITGDDPIAACDKGLIDYTTAAEFSKVGLVLDADERFLIGVYENGESPQWREVTYAHAAELRRLLSAPIVAYGSAQGVMHAWHSGATPPFFQLRELATGDLVRCEYPPQLHAKVLRAHEQLEKTVVHVYGRIRWDRTKNHILEIVADDIELTQPLTDIEFHRLFGSMPEFTGEMTTDEYVDWIRGSDD